MLAAADDDDTAAAAGPVVDDHLVVFAAATGFSTLLVLLADVVELNSRLEAAAVLECPVVTVDNDDDKLVVVGFDDVDC